METKTEIDNIILECNNIHEPEKKTKNTINEDKINEDINEEIKILINEYKKMNIAPELDNIVIEGNNIHEPQKKNKTIIIEDDINEEIKNFINEYINEQLKNINKEKKGRKNISYAFRGIGDVGEELATIINPNSLCSASKGGCSFDNFVINSDGEIISATEVKTCCHIQPKQCKKCSKKTPYYQEKCSYCNNNEFKKITDSRFGIDAKAHFEYISLLKNYLLIYINDIDNIIKFSVFVIKSDNIYFNNYIQNQFKNSEKSNTCNLLPFSYDFYSSGPIKIIDLEYDLSGNLQNDYIDRFNDNYLDFNTECLTLEEKNKYYIPYDTKTIPYTEIKDRLELRNKNLNKNRGKTTRL
jgi:hypothetical protein